MSVTRGTPTNVFKQRLAMGQQQLGLWSVLANGYSAELLAGCGYDWILIDAEHGPNDLRTVLAQLQGIAAAASLLGNQAETLSQPVVRLPHGESPLIKQFLEIGAQNLLIPMVDTQQQASDLVAATRYPPVGRRGMGSGLGRSSRWGRLTDYVRMADDSICLIAQIETQTALRNIAEIAGVEGIDAVLFGPSDLAADLGLPGQPSHPRVAEAIRCGVDDLRPTGKPAGIMLTHVPEVQNWLEAGISFAGVGVDSSLLIAAADELLARFRPGHPSIAERVSSY